MSTTFDLPALSQTAAQKMLSLLAEKGGAPGPTPDTVKLGISDLQARCVAFDVRAQEPDGFGAAIGIEITGPNLKQPLRDVTGARADTVENAVGGAIEAWLHGLFIPLRDALGDTYVPYRYGVQQMDQSGESRDWCVYESPMHIGCEAQVHEKIAEQLKDPPLFGRIVEGGLLPNLATDEVHWLKIDAIGENAGTMRVEGVFNGKPWPNVDLLFKDFAWPGNGVQMIRQYWVLVTN